MTRKLEALIAETAHQLNIGVELPPDLEALGCGYAHFEDTKQLRLFIDVDETTYSIYVDSLDLLVEQARAELDTKLGVLWFIIPVERPTVLAHMLDIERY